MASAIRGSDDPEWQRWKMLRDDAIERGMIDLAMVYERSLMNLGFEIIKQYRQILNRQIGTKT